MLRRKPDIVEFIVDVIIRIASAQDHELSTVVELATAAGCSERTFRYRCRLAGVTPKACLDFIRCLRLVIRTDGSAWSPRTMLSHVIADDRTIERLVTAAGFRTSSQPSVEDFLRHQRLMRSSSLLVALTDRLVNRRSPVDRADVVLT